MEKAVYRDPVYGFLQFISQYERFSKINLGRKILDCGAGGQTPPLGLFYEYGFDAWGIDISDEHVKAAKDFFEKQNMEVNISIGDMREIPCDDETFDFVYEFYSMCHLTKSDIRKTIREMKRVAKEGALLFLGFAMDDTWPIEGEEIGNGEFLIFEHTDDEVVHSIFKEDELDDYLVGFEILYKERRTMNFGFWNKRTSKEDWMERYSEKWANYTRAEWERMYDERLSKQNYTHIFYILKK